MSRREARPVGTQQDAQLMEKDGLNRRMRIHTIGFRVYIYVDTHNSQCAAKGIGDSEEPRAGKKRIDPF